MAKKVKCIECNNSMNWAIPSIEILKENPLAVISLKKSIVCGHTMKTKSTEQCQYCKHYKAQDDFHKNCRKQWECELKVTLDKLN
jgi:hypothetical protein